MAVRQTDPYSIMQGDQYKIPFSITDAKGRVLTDEQLDDVEICVGLIKYHKPDIVYNSLLQTWDFPLLQSESFRIAEEKVPVKIRVKTVDNEIIGIDLGKINVFESISKEEL